MLRAAGTGLVEPVELTTSGDVFVVVAAGVLGLLIGSFLNVVIARVPDGQSIVRPPSHCPHCGEPIRARDNFPVVSWLVLRGKGRCCGEPISVRYPLVELSTGLAFAGIAAWAGLSWMLPALFWLAGITIALALIDVDHQRLPNAITFPSYPIAAALLVIPALTAGEPGRLTRMLICGAASYVFYFVLMVINPRGMGFGDVKLSGILGGYLGFVGYGPAVTGLFLGFLVGGVGGLLLIAARRAGMKSLIPFGPYMLAGAWLAVVWGQDLTDWYLRQSGISG